MSNAICTKCGQEYGWRNQRGVRLADNPSPCCRAPGKAVGDRKALPPLVCPKCRKGGMRRRNKEGRGPENVSSQMYWRLRFCPRCEEWVEPLVMKAS